MLAPTWGRWGVAGAPGWLSEGVGRPRCTESLLRAPVPFPPVAVPVVDIDPDSDVRAGLAAALVRGSLVRGFGLLLIDAPFGLSELPDDPTSLPRAHP